MSKPQSENNAPAAAPEAAQPEPQPAATAVEYAFTPEEAAIIRQAVVEMNAKQNELSALVRLVAAQQKMTNAQLKADLSGLIQA